MNDKERHMLAALAKCRQRSQSDTVRVLIAEAAERELISQGLSTPDDDQLTQLSSSSKKSTIVDEDLQSDRKE